MPTDEAVSDPLVHLSDDVEVGAHHHSVWDNDEDDDEESTALFLETGDPRHLKGTGEVAHALPPPRTALHPWSEEEEMRLRSLAIQYNEKNWKKVAEHFPNRTFAQCMQHWKTNLNPRVGKGAWTPKEDAKLIQLVQKYGRKWALIADYLPRRIGKRCRERYVNHLCPDIRKGEWTAEEDQILVSGREELGNRWADLAKMIPGRSVNDIKNRWYAMQRKHLAESVNNPNRTIDNTSNNNTASLSEVFDNEAAQQEPAAKRAKRGNGSGSARSGKASRWSEEEEEMLKSMVDQFGPKKWLFISSHIPGRSDLQCMQHWQHVLNPKVVKGKGSWTADEDKKLLERVAVLGNKWSKVADHLPGRIGKQCRERYLNHLDPTLKKEPWTPEEDSILIEMHEKHWNKWAAIAKAIPGRSDNDVKNRWYSTIVSRSNPGAKSSTTSRATGPRRSKGTATTAAAAELTAEQLSFDAIAEDIENSATGHTV